MKRNLRLVELSLIVMAALALSAFSTMTARADDGTLPPIATPAATQSADASAAAATPAATAAPADISATQEAATATAAATEAATAAVAPVDTTTAATQAAATATPEPATTEAATASAATEEAATAAPADATAAAPTEAATPAPEAAVAQAGAPLSQIPDGTDVVLLDNTGNPVDAGSPEAADIIAHGDPIWCPTGIAPKPKTGGCTDTFSTFNGGFLTGTGQSGLSGKGVSGTIWISNTYTGEGSSVTLDGGLGTTVNFALTIQGGWNGNSTGTLIAGNSTFNAPLIINWNADVTINNITVSDTTTTGNVLVVNTPKNITLTNVTVEDNPNASVGAGLSNTSGTGNVTITNGNFSNNASGVGLKFGSHGAITLSGVVANNNGDTGAQMDNSGASTPMNVTITNSNFESNVGTGLQATSKGTITVSGIKADDNSGAGAYLNNSTAGTPKNVIITGSGNEFNGNHSNGIQIVSQGAISLMDIDALNNTGDGAYLNNTSAAAPQAITLTGSNVFSENGFIGLESYSKGPITANNLIANGNSNWGAYLDNSTAVAAQAVTLTGASNQFKFNMAGLIIFSKGAITLNSITANDNRGDPGNGYASGAQMDDCIWVGSACTGSGNIALTGTNAFENNYRTGLAAKSAGTIAINNLSADGNGWDLVTPANSNGSGAVLDNSSAAAPKSITLTGVGSFNGNYNDGLRAISLGAIAAGNLDAENNGGYGAYLDNCGWDYGGGSPFCHFTFANGITLTGANTFKGNGGDGLWATSRGAISAGSLTVNNNTYDGALLNNLWTGATGGITITGVNTFNGNGNSGLFACSNGAISASGLTANADAFGAQIYNGYAATALPVTLTGNNVFSNDSYGLIINSKGTITVSNVTADYNFGGSKNSTDGVNLDNCLWDSGSNKCLGSGDVILSGTNSFLNNYFNGLYIYSAGNITANALTASGNGLAGGVPADAGGNGAVLDNSKALTAKTVTIGGSSVFNGNVGIGLLVISKGTITAGNLTATGNANEGVILDNCAWDIPSNKCTGTGNSALTGTNLFNSNGSNGFDAFSRGSISVGNITANLNSGVGAYLYNQYAGVVGGITITGANTFTHNGFNGVEADSFGVISVNNLDAENNTGNGAYLDNCGWDYNSGSPVCHSTLANAITLTGANTFKNNDANGLWATSRGSISTSSITANLNGGTGVYLDDQWTGAVGGITMTGTNIINNSTLSGLIALSNGVISTNNLTANGNGNNGAILLNNVAGKSAGITLAGTNVFTGNTWSGVEADSFGAISANNLDAENNPRNGARIDNSGAATPQPVTITGTNVFSGNVQDGVDVLSKGAIAVSGITASGNGQDGALMNNLASTSASPQNVTLTGTNLLNTNGDSGLVITTYGAIAVNNLTATGNGLNHNASTGFGAHLDTCAYSGGVCDASAPVKGITLTGVNTFNGNYLDGLWAVAKGPISASSLTAGSNQRDGANLNNQWSTGTAGGITLTGTNSFLANLRMGLATYSKGPISVNNITADNNSADGMYVEAIGLLNTPQSATFTGANTILINGGNGLEVRATGNITINNLTAGGNSEIGAYLDNCLFSGSCTGAGNIALTGANTFNGNHQSGLWVTTKGSVSVNNLTANSNTENGASINDILGTAASPQNVTLTGTNVLNSNGDTGLIITTYGAIAVNNLTASGNGLNHNISTGYGAHLDTCAYSGSACDASALAKGITLTGTNTFNDDYLFGLWAIAKGPISASNLTADSNQAEGALLDNKRGTGSAGGITVTGANAFLGNTGIGLETYSNGSISVNNITASNNGGDGMYVEAFGLLPATPQSVTFTGTNTFLNDGDHTAHAGDGLWVNADGNITISNLTAKDNAADGALLDDSTGSGSITLTGINAFYNNYDDGLYMHTTKNSTVSGLTSDKNGGMGVYGSAGGAIVVLGGSMTGNGSYGWDFVAGTTITLKGVFAYGNNGGVGDTAHNVPLIIVRSYP